MSQQALSRWEREVSSCSVAMLDKWASALGGYLVVDVRVNGEPPLADARHAALQNWLVQLLLMLGWVVEAEVSFNHFGDRGRIDVLAYHPLLGILLVIEIKTRIVDVQDTLGRLDTKVRVASELAQQRGWATTTIVPAFIIRDNGTSRRRVTTHAALFARFAFRGTDARRWLRRPTLPAPTGILLFQADPSK